MTCTPQRATVILALLFVSSAFGEVIFSRRVYKEHGASYQQIWTWNPADGALKELTHSPRDHYDPNCDGRIVKFTSPSGDLTDHVKLWTLNPATGGEKAIGPAPESQGTSDSQSPSCDQFAKLGELEACGKGETLVVSRSDRQIGRFQIQVDTCPIDNHGTIGKCETPIRSLDWTEDGKWLLIGEEGLNDASGQRQDDYYLVTPQGLAPFPGQQRKHNVWVQQLMFFDPAKGTPTAITSGLTNNVDPSWCEGAHFAVSPTVAGNGRASARNDAYSRP